MRARPRSVVVVAASGLAVAALAYALVHGWSSVRRYDWNIGPSWIVGAAAVLSVGYVGAAAAYARLVVELHPPARPHVGALERTWALSLLGRYVPGNVLMVAGRLELGRSVGVPRRISLAASLYEQVLMLAASAVGGLFYVGLYGDLGHGLGWVVAFVPLIGVALHPRVLGPASTAALRRAGREPMEILLTPAQTALAFAWYAGVQALVGLGAWMLTRAAGADAPVALVSLGFLLAFTVSMLAFVLPSGLGVREGVLALVLAPRLPGGVAVAVSIGLRFAITLFELGFVALMSAAWRHRRGGHYPLAVRDDAG